MEALMRFSIVIPLEFHRGLSERCIGAWAGGQTYPRDQFEILIAAPETHDPAELQVLANLLAPHDRMLRFPFHHDMPLVAEAARQAQGETLVFTEAHCLPRSDFLEQSAAILAEHPDWAGFSGRSIPLTHNLLSEIEAEMYDEHISANMRRHPWLKVLDQCFIVRRAAYESSGGVEPQFGHFAEWILAARLHRKGLKIGFDPRVAIEHYYVGDLDELEEFTLDFATGQMRFAQQVGTDPCGDLFDEVREWSDRHRWNPAVAASFNCLLRRDFLRFPRSAGQNRLGMGQSASWPWASAWTWLGRRCLPQQARIALQRLHNRRLRATVNRHLRSNERELAKAAFLLLIEGWVCEARLQFLANEQRQPTTAGLTPSASCSEWLPRRIESVATCGFHALERWNRTRFRWSEPATMIWLPPLQGDWRITIECPAILPVSHRQAARFYLNERLIPAEQITHRANDTVIQYSDSSSEGLRLSWICAPLASPADDRQLGLPISRVSWEKTEVSQPAPARSQEPAPTIYFLHVPKCAGTTTRMLLSNRFEASEVLGAFDPSFYYARQLPDHPEIQLPYTFAGGHFGWDLPTLVPGRRWRVVTLLREPLERLLSLFDYMRQGDRLEAELDFTDWIEHGMFVRDLMQAHFVPGTCQMDARGIKAVSEALRLHFPDAVTHLRSCEIVGLQERLEDTLNLFCAATSSLPPPRIPKVNVTLHRTRRAEIEARTLRLLETHLPSECELYAAGKALFDQQVSRLRQQLSEEAGQELDTSGMRNALRRRYFARRSREIMEQGFHREIHWSPADPFEGDNLHDRERHAGQTLRWTGPSQETIGYIPIDPTHRMGIELRLHPATPAAHAQGARLFVNAREVPLCCKATDSGYALTGLFDPEQPPEEFGLLSEFKLLTPTIRGANEFRELGVALQSIHVHVQSAASPAPVLRVDPAASTLAARSARSPLHDKGLIRDA
jgi:hypothetical protein